jgi:predicted AlkP superfamily pyrophosphatase or phosphodiesterase
MPQRYHYRSHRRIPPIVGIADEGWTITSHAQLEHDREQNVPMGGTHGFDPASPSMQALFVAAGPALRRSVVVPAFENIHLYDFFCRVLGIAAAANDGDAAVTRDLFER